MTATALTLAAFLVARIEEDEAWANAAIVTPGASHWHWVDPETDVPLTLDPFTQEYVNDGEGASMRTVEEVRPVTWEGGSPLPDFIVWQVDETPTGAAGHIARHDPARVLAECESKRAIVKLHEPYPTVQRMIYGDITPCAECGSPDDSPIAWPCPTLRALAKPCADHPDFDPAWL